MGLVLDPAAPQGDGAPEIEVTEEMVEAGTREFCGYDPRVESPEEAVRAIYAAMRAVSPCR